MQTVNGARSNQTSDPSDNGVAQLSGWLIGKPKVVDYILAF